MITLAQARKIVVDEASLMPVERVTLPEALHRCLAEEVIADMDMPPFRKAAVDGYACRRSDLGQSLKSIGTAAAGKSPFTTLTPGVCLKIMTGAAVPRGADTIIMVEQTTINPDGEVVFHGETSSPNICERGEDCLRGEVLIAKNTLVAPHHIAIMAMAGNHNPLVYKRPRVAVVVTGDELVEPHQIPGETAIRNSNGWQLIAQIAGVGALADYRGIVPDNFALLRDTIRQAADDADLVILTGGVSLGDYDFVPSVLESLGASIIFKEIAVQPGKPTLFARLNQTPVVGLPGNPVSSLVQFKLLVEPMLQVMTGGTGEWNRITLPMGQAHQRKKASRQSFFPIKIINGKAIPIQYNGSAHIRAFAEADGIVSFDIGQTRLEEGEIVAVTPIS